MTGRAVHDGRLEQRPAPGASTHEWTALGTYVRLATSPADALADAVRLASDVLDEVDRACSRFRSDSDLVRANARAGRPTDVSPLLAAAVQVAVAAAAESDGLVDLTLGHALVAVGYDRDLALLPQAATDPAMVPVPARTGAWREVEVDPSGVVTVPDGCALDLGATGKAWAADLVVASIADALGVDVVASLGGDVAVHGSMPWPVAVSEVVGAVDAVDVVMVPAGGLATSTTLARRWVRGGVPRHHLLDPRTGEPTRGPWRTVSAFGQTAVAANTATTAAIVRGDEALDWLHAKDVAARLVAQDGTVVRTPGWSGQVVSS
ncbi:MAG: FAD:protein FMN transferase [Angustibacter sp.]